MSRTYFKVDAKADWEVGDVLSNDGKTLTINPKESKPGDCGPVSIPRELTAPFSASAEEGVEDLASLDVLHEPAILHNLTTRCDASKYYTSVGDVLLAVNPFKPLDCYGTDSIQAYSKPLASPQTLVEVDDPPHIFKVARAAVRSMRTEKKSQAILISGESGAGKTESTKHILHFLTHCASGDGPRRMSEAPVEEKIMASNPVLEAFGNAKTVHNNNSSRFGKFFQVQYNNNDTIVGAKVLIYLLERSRVAKIGPGERNYHVFYQLCAGATAEQRQAFDLGPATAFYYLTSPDGIVEEIPNVDDAREFSTLLAALKSVGISATETNAIMQCLAGILHLGNIQMVPKAGAENASVVGNMETLQIAAGLLGFEFITLEIALTTKGLATSRSSCYSIPLTPHQASVARDALAKSIYTRIFDYLVKKVSTSMEAPEDKVQRHIGVLDIFGFESFEKNSLEQLCINYSNEKLHQLFIKAVIEGELKLYAEEGINVADCAKNAEKVSNKAFLAALEDRRGGGASPLVGSGI
ncbi:hypothetical protein CYMTET_16678 [Cymbomonas tetramitiformis]|uniref:Myosin motor domain-containing protein n=1 Tax=Cymbomonas tetramitiformis TaxID=36881 RepID=A0AAE0L812_9CHLO|nr:hypothetical protein CYMTET_16678 [Cymbomonas tetramitiformis]